MNTPTVSIVEETTKTTLDILLERIEQCGPPRRGIVYPSSLKVAIAEYCYNRVICQGYAWVKMSEDLKISIPSLKTWTTQEYGKGKRGSGTFKNEPAASKISTESVASKKLQETLDKINTDLVTPQGYTLKNIPLSVALLLANAEQPWKIECEIQVNSSTPKLLENRSPLSIE